MKYIKNISILLAASLLIMACETQMIERQNELNFQTGGYMRTVTPFPATGTTFSVSKANMGGTKMELVAEAVTPNAGASFASYDLSIQFVDATPANGNKSVALTVLRSIPASAYAKDATTGYPRATIAVTGTEALTATKLTAADVSKGDYFEITAVMKLTDGRSFSVANTGTNVLSQPFYSSPFSYRLNVLD
jgi:hypothetical protein